MAHWIKAQSREKKKTQPPRKNIYENKEVEIKIIFKYKTQSTNTKY